MHTEQRFTSGEERANAISHGLGLLLAITGMILLLVFSKKPANVLNIVSLNIYSATLVVLFLSSTLNHALKKGRAKEFFHNFDQIAIFLLIAGTYTPIALIGLKEDWGWTMFGTQWLIAITGIIVKILLPNKFEKGVNIFFMFSYIIMGWMLLLFLLPLFRNLTNEVIILIFSGGICFTLGTIFFKIKKLRYAHLIWHLFVVAGSVLHWIAILNI